MGEEFLTWRIGAVEVTRVEARVTAVPHGSIISALTPDVVDRYRPVIDPFVAADGRMLLSVHSFVVRSEGSTIVVDTCVGDHGERPLPPDPDFPDRLDGAIEGGLGGVDTVLCTHLHFDHVGWNTRRGPGGELVPTFPDARYLVTQAELDALAEHDHHGIGPVSVEPLAAAGQLVVVPPDHRLTRDVVLVPTPGHSPGHVSVLIESDGESALITGDMVHSPIQLADPAITADRFDADPAAAVATRRAVIDRFAGTPTILLGTHFPPPTAVRIVRTADGGTAFDATI